MSESLFGYKEDNLKSYPVYNYDENMEKRKKEIKKYLEQWNLNYESLNEGEEEEELRRYYYTHPYSKVKFETIRIEFSDGEEILVPKYNEEADKEGNSGYKVKKERGYEERMILSEMTYTVREDGSVERMAFNDFWKTRRGKRHEKYLNYLKKRKEKKRVYDQERYKRIRQGLVV